MYSTNYYEILERVNRGHQFEAFVKKGFLYKDEHGRRHVLPQSLKDILATVGFLALLYGGYKGIEYYDANLIPSMIDKVKGLFTPESQSIVNDDTLSRLFSHNSITDDILKRLTDKYV